MTVMDRFVDYKTYIESGDWLNRCVKFFGDHPNCSVRACRKRWHEGNVQIHHRTYKRLGRELRTDLVPLCDSCHGEAHRMAVWYTKNSPDEQLSSDEALRRGTWSVLFGGGSVELLKELEAADAANGEYNGAPR